jgi:hypothetical protein
LKANKELNGTKEIYEHGGSPEARLTTAIRGATSKAKSLLKDIVSASLFIVIVNPH